MRNEGFCTESIRANSQKIEDMLTTIESTTSLYSNDDRRSSGAYSTRLGTVWHFLPFLRLLAIIRKEGIPRIFQLFFFIDGTQFSRALTTNEKLNAEQVTIFWRENSKLEITIFQALIRDKETQWQLDHNDNGLEQLNHSQPRSSLIPMTLINNKGTIPNWPLGGC